MCVPVRVVSQVHPAVLTMGGDQSRETKAEEREDRREKQQQSAAADSKQGEGSFVSTASVSPCHRRRNVEIATNS